MASPSRHRKQKPNYVFSSSSDSDSYSSDPDYSTTSSQRASKRRNNNSCTRRRKETQMVDSSVKWSAMTRRSHPFKNSNAGASSSSSKENEQATPMKKTVLSWLLDSNQIQENEQVSYIGVNKQIVMATGRITRGRILCSCCREEINVWDFEKHAGSDLRRPYERIFLSKSHTPLFNCLKEAWNIGKEKKRRQFYFFEPKEDAEDASDDACLVCADGGKLICCGKCPSTFHSFCMNMERDPVGNWLCPFCVCKYCGLGGDESKELITCTQCEKKFHWACLIEEKEKEKEAVDLNCSKLYCEQSCREIYDKLESLIGVRNKFNDKYYWQIIRPTNDNCLNDLENNAKVAVAWNLINESFETITDRFTGIDVVQNVIYSCGSNLTRINFRRFYTFIMEKDDEIVCAACVRVHGRRITEMPFIATAENYRRQGICGMLLAVIESILCSFKVEKLILPAVKEVQTMWKSYGFTEIDSELMREISSYNILMFPGLVRLQKDLGQHITADPGVGAGADGNNMNNDNQNDGRQRLLLDLNVEPPPEEDSV